MAGYTRQSAGSIVTGATILASHFNAEYNQLQSAFSASTGHNHDGTTGGGAAIPTAGLDGLTSSSAGMVVAGSNALLVRTLTGTSNEITVTNGTGVSGNPTLSLPSALTFTGKTVTGGTFTTPTINVNDNVLSIRDNSDTTKVLQFECSGITTGTTRTLTIPDVSSTILVASNIGSSVQAYDADLAALAALASTGLVARTAANTYAERTITGTTNRLDVTNGNGVSGNPTLDISTSYVGQSSITTLGTISTGTWNATTLDVTYGGTGQTTANAAFNALAPSQTGNSGKYLTTDGSNTSWGTIAAGFADPGGNGIVVRTALNTSTNRTITAGTNISVSNGDGVSGNPTISFNGTLPVANGGTGATSLTANNVLLGNGTSAVQVVAPSTSGNILTSNGSTWTSAAFPTRVSSVATNNGLTGGTITTTGTIGIDTNNALGVGAMCILQNATGSTITAGSTAAGTSLNLVTGWTTTTLSVSAAKASGTWRNIMGADIANTNFGLFIRTA